MNILTKVAFGVFGAAYIICLIIFVIVLRRKFYEPLEKLNKAMELLDDVAGNILKEKNQQFRGYERSDTRKFVGRLRLCKSR